MTDHRPSRFCPHRFCRPLHGITAIAGLAFICAAASDEPVLLLIMIVSGLFAVAIYRIVHKQTMTESVHEEVDGQVRYEARPAWARAAAASDAVLAAATVTIFVLSCVTWQSDASDAATSRIGVGVALAVGVAVTVGIELLHRKAVIVQKAEGSR